MTVLQVWDKRVMGRNNKSAGLFVCHTEGMTHMDPQGGSHFL